MTKINGPELGPMLKLIGDFTISTCNKSGELLDNKITNVEFNDWLEGAFQNLESNITVKVPRILSEVEKLGWEFKKLKTYDIKRAHTNAMIASKKTLAEGVSCFIMMLALQEIIQERENENSI